MFSLEAEERCGHLVTADMKKLWAAQMGLLKELQRICEKHGIKYYAIEGTLLGAIRHGGYIPWDDDIDVGMLSDDYDRFCKVVVDELPQYYQFQHFSTQDGINVGIARIRDSRTTSCTNHEYKLFADTEDYNCGIFIDIFPLFNAPDNIIKRKFQTLKTYFCNLGLLGFIEEKRLQAEGKNKADTGTVKCYVSAWRILRKFMDYSKMAQKRYNALKMYKKEKCIGMIGFYGYQDKAIWDKSYFKETVELPFEDMTITCPKEYDKILRKRYGDYNVFVKGTSVHTFAVVDPDTPYKEKLKDRYKKAK